MSASTKPWATEKPEVKAILDAVAEIGWTVSTTTSGYRIQAPGGGTAMVHKTNSDHRWVANTWTDLNKAGYKLARAAFDQAAAGRREALRAEARVTSERLLAEAQRKSDQRNKEALARARAAGYLTDLNLLFTPHPGPPITYTVIVTPEVAQQLLDLNVDNQRNLEKARVKRFAGFILNNKWAHTHQGIAISTEGRMMDGMHRAAGIVEADCEVTMQVTIGVDPAAFVVMDTGKSRNGADVLKIAGYDATPALSAAARLLYAYNAIAAAEEEGRPAPSWRSFRLSNSDIMDVVTSTDGGLPEAVEWEARLRVAKTAKLVPATTIVGAYLIHRVWDRTSTSIVRFWQGLMSPYGLDPGDPRIALHRYLVNTLERRGQKGRRDAFPQLPLLLKTFNYTMTGAPLTLASWKEVEGLPVLIQPTTDSVGAVAHQRAS